MKLENYYASKVLMVEPTNFFYNKETAEDNEFMNEVDMDNKEIQRKAKEEHGRLVDAITDAGVEVLLYKQKAKDSPDSIFPNNWLTTHMYPGMMEHPLVWVYPMKAPTRQKEVNYEIVDDLLNSMPKSHLIDFTAYHDYGEACEGTGVLIFDAPNKSVYANLSQRCKPDAFSHFIEVFNDNITETFELVTFSAKTKTGKPIYHTNVMFSMLPYHGVVCLESFENDQEHQKIKEEIEDKHLNVHPRKIVDLSLKEVHQMWGNILGVKNDQDEFWVIMSEKAYNGFTEAHRNELESNYKIIKADVETIENVGGGSARCMVAEIFD